MGTAKLGSDTLWKSVNDVNSENLIHRSKIDPRYKVYPQRFSPAVLNGTSHNYVHTRYAKILVIDSQHGVAYNRESPQIIIVKFGNFVLIPEIKVNCLLAAWRPGRNDTILTVLKNNKILLADFVEVKVKLLMCEFSRV